MHNKKQTRTNRREAQTAGPETGLHGRRDLLRWGLGAGAFGAGALGMSGLTDAQPLGAQTLGPSSQSKAAGAAPRDAQAVDDYSALVYVFLYGGNDAFNTVVPRNGAAYNAYAATRQNLALDAGSLLPINPATAGDYNLGLHPSLTGLKQRFDEGRLAVVANTGTLVEPVTQAQVLNGTGTLPQYLYSHSDQQLQWQSNSAIAPFERGWGGQLADRLVHLNGDTLLSPAITLSGANLFQIGSKVQPYAMGPYGPIEVKGFWGTQGALRKQAFEDLLKTQHKHPLEYKFSRTQVEAMELGKLLADTLEGQAPLSTVFPDDNWGATLLKVIVQTIQARKALGMRRQVFFVGLGGWDMHDDLMSLHGPHLTELDAALSAFQAGLDEIGADSQVTTMVGSEFGRTLTSNGTGSDHGWGGHTFVLGSGVRGDLYGQLPDLSIDSSDDAGYGRIIPTTGSDQVSATLARWYGLKSQQVSKLFPNLTNFSSSDLGFMG